MLDALQAIGKQHVTETVIKKLRDFVRTHRLAQKLKRRAKRAPHWMLPYIDALLVEE